jgi:threonine/homoserine/homoserine lactone efflux protein
LAEFILTVLFLELTPGPNMTYLATLTLDRGRTAGLLATAGVAAGLSVHAVVAAFGVGALIGRVPLVYDLLRWTGVAYLLYLAWETWQSNGRPDPALADAASPSSFWRGFFSNLFNPKSIVFFVSVVPGFVRLNPDAPSLLVQMARLGAIYIGIATAIHTSIVLLAGRLRPLLMSGPHGNSVRRMLALGLVLVVAWLAWTTRRS